MDTSRHLRARFYYTALDAVCMAPTRPTRARAHLLRDACTRPMSNFDRVGTLTQLLEGLAPGAMRWLRGRILDLRTLPLRDGDVAPLAYGTRTSCMRLPGAPARVLKVTRPSMGCDARTAQRMARDGRDFYETLGRWYSGIPRLLPKTLHLVVHGPVRGTVAAVQIQQMIPAGGRDLLRDHTDDELVSLLLRYPRFHRDFRRFVRGTRRAWDEEGRFLDMVGRDNVLVLPGPDGPELRVPDFGIWDLEFRRGERPDLYARAVDAVKRLERTLARADAARGDAYEAGQDTAGDDDDDSGRLAAPSRSGSDAALKG